MMASHAPAFLAGLFRASMSAALVVGLVLIARAFVFRGPAARWRSALWALVLVRLLLPALPASRFSLLNARAWFKPVRLTPPVAAIYVPLPGSRQVTLSGFLPPDAAVPLPTLAVPQSAVPRWPTILLAIWLAGGAFVIVRRAISHARFIRRLARDAVVVDGEWIDALNEACGRMGIRKRPMLRITDAVPTPALAGLIHPQLLLPPSTVQSLTKAQLRLVMLHELAHLRRADLWIDAATTLVLALHWFNPVAWLAAALYRSDRELAREAMVIRAAGEDAAQDYGRVIVLLLERLALAGPTPAAAVGILERWGGIRQRVRAVAEYRRPRLASALLAALAVLLVGCAGLTNGKNSSAGDAAIQPPPVSPVSQAMRAKLDQKLGRFVFNDAPLPNVLDALAAQAGLHIVVKWDVLQAAGVTRGATVSVDNRVGEPTVKDLLNEILLVNGDGPRARLRFGVSGENVVVSTAADLDVGEAVTRTYEIKDLSVEIPDFDNAPTLGSIPTTAPSSAKIDPSEKTLTRAQRIEVIVQLVKQCVDPQSWDHYATIRDDSGCIVVFQTPGNHEQIKALLEQLRETRGLQINLQALFFTVDADAGDLGPEFAGQAQRSRPNQAATRAGMMSGTYLSDDQVSQLLAKLASQRGVHQVAAPRITLFNGQRAWVMAAQSTKYVSDFKAAAGGVVPPRYEPQLDVVNTGYLFDAQATISADRKYVVTTLRPQISQLERLDEFPFEPSGLPLKDGHRFVLQRPIVSASNMQTTVSIPDRFTLLTAGFSPLDAMPTSAKKLGNQPGTPNRSFILVRATIVLEAHARVPKHDALR